MLVYFVYKIIVYFTMVIRITQNRNVFVNIRLSRKAQAVMFEHTLKNFGKLYILHLNKMSCCVSGRCAVRSLRDIWRVGMHA